MPLPRPQIPLPLMVSLPPERTPLYNHPLPALEAWLHGIGARQDPDRPEHWQLSRADWNADLTLESEEIAVVWQDGGPGRLRRFPYGLCRADVEAAIFAGP